MLDQYNLVIEVNTMHPWVVKWLVNLTVISILCSYRGRSMRLLLRPWIAHLHVAIRFFLQISSSAHSGGFTTAGKEYANLISAGCLRFLNKLIVYIIHIFKWNDSIKWFHIPVCISLSLSPSINWNANESNATWFIIWTKQLQSLILNHMDVDTRNENWGPQILRLLGRFKAQPCIWGHRNVLKSDPMNKIQN